MNIQSTDVAGHALVTLVGRMLMAAIFIMAGVNKINGYEGTQGYMDSMGVPGILLPLVILLEAGGGLALVVGWQTRLTAFLLAGFTIVSAAIFHAELGDKMQFILFMKNISMAGGLLTIMAWGPGAWSLDSRKAGRSDIGR